MNSISDRKILSLWMEIFLRHFVEELKLALQSVVYCKYLHYSFKNGLNCLQMQYFIEHKTNAGPTYAILSFRQGLYICMSAMDFRFS